MKYTLLIGVLLAFLVSPQLSYANCTLQTYIINGKPVTCTICQMGFQTIVTCS